MKPDLEPIHVAHSQDDTPLAVPFVPTAFLWAGLIVAGMLVTTMVVRLAGVPLHLWAIAVGFGGVLVAFYALRRVWRRTVTGWRPARDGARSDPSFRIRVVGEGGETQPLVADLRDEPFEPFIAFTWFAVSFMKPGTARAAADAAAAGAKRPLPAAESDLTVPQRWLIGVLTAVFIPGVFLVQWVALHTKQPFGPVQVMAGLGLAGMAAAWATPTYVRIAPGTLDILRFGWRPSGLPAFERWDLRTCRVLVDARLGVIRVSDNEELPRRTLVLRAAQAACRKRALMRAVLVAARTRHPTPPLPTDALVG